jgi:hypothetical protein
MTIHCYKCGAEDEIVTETEFPFRPFKAWMVTQDGWLCVKCQHENLANFIRNATDKEFFDALDGKSQEE